VLLDPDAAEVVALIPTLGTDADRLARCVTSLESQTMELGVVVLVNSPETGRIHDLPGEVVVVECGLNLGWAGALTFGRSLADPGYLWLVQDDMVAAPDALAVLRAALEADRTLGLVSPVTVGDDGLVPAHSLGGSLESDGVLRTWFPPVATSPDELSGLTEMSYVASRGMLVRARAWDDAGGMCPLFHPVMYADVDFCVGVRRAGWSVASVSRAWVRHTQNGSTTRPFAQFLGVRNSALFAARRFPGSEDDEGRPSPAASLGGPIHPQLPAALVGQIAQAAADALLDLGYRHTAATAALESRVATLETTLAEQATELHRVRSRLRRARRQLAHARSWRGRLGLVRRNSGA
jgi:GT2 family glycosyltransferase